jgi:hypothetical protein
VESESVVVEQIIRLFRRQPGVWELVDAPRELRDTDVAIRDARGALVAYARPAAA